MARAVFVFSETSPAAPGTAASSQTVSGGAGPLGYLPNGVAGPICDFDACDVIAELRGATGGTLDVYVQISPDDGANWYDIIHFPQLANGAAAVIYQAPISNATTTTFSVVVGKNLSPALTVSGTTGVVNGAFSDRMRLVMVAGSGTSAGAAIVVRVAAQRSEGGSRI